MYLMILLLSVLDPVWLLRAAVGDDGPVEARRAPLVAAARLCGFFGPWLRLEDAVTLPLPLLLLSLSTVVALLAPFRFVGGIACLAALSSSSSSSSSKKTKNGLP